MKNHRNKHKSVYCYRRLHYRNIHYQPRHHQNNKVPL
uniref:Uncharacterized protein n=1 Tax=Myoviridae sp. ct9dX1 TaxID=2827665 RepID=A0A8S5TJW6_9CAUD|nr:MAG TPA: hypothetical protein [Myoviridae sp. ct9dX1]